MTDLAAYDPEAYRAAVHALSHIRPGKRIFVGSGCAEPQFLVRALVEQHQHFRDNEIVHLLTLGIAPYAEPQYRAHFQHNAFFIGPNVRSAVAAGYADYTPIFLSEIPRLFQTGQTPIHAALIQVSPPDEKGFVSFGISVDIVKAAVETADLIIAQINRNMPETLGNAKIPLSKIHFAFSCDEPIIELPMSEPDPTAMRIGRHVAGLIHDGDTLQLGIGNIPNAVLRQLGQKNDLGIHTEMFSDGILSLYRNGQITNRFKGLHDGVSITSFIMGSRELYDMVHRNSDFAFYPSEYVNDPFVIGQNQNMVSVNSAIEIDLTGQVCADSMGNQFFSGIGGQVDFVRGARRSKGGRSIIALPSTARGGKLSRIVFSLKPGAGVVTSRGDVDYVVTEFGIAYLHGMSIRERALALLQIAHPDFRESLLEELKANRYVQPDQQFICAPEGPLAKFIPAKASFEDFTLYFRALRPCDEKPLQSFFYSHSMETISHRYMGDVRAMPHKRAMQAVLVDYDRDFAIAGYDSNSPFAKIACIARFVQYDDDGAATIGLVVREELQGKGIGRFLLDLLIQAARSKEIRELRAFIRPSNSAMQRLFSIFGFEMQDSDYRDFALYVLTLQDQKTEVCD